MTTTRHFKEGQRVVYMPGIANGDPKHEACERGVVMGVGAIVVHVKFENDLHTKPCNPDTLKIEI